MEPWRGTLNMVAQYLPAGHFACILIVFQAAMAAQGRSGDFVDVSMNIVGVQDRIVLKAAGVTCRRSGCAQDLRATAVVTPMACRKLRREISCFMEKRLPLKILFVFIGRTEPA